MSNNTIVIIGRLGSDPEQKGSAVKLNIAVDRPGKKDGQKVTDWFTVWLHDKPAEVATEYLHKGDMVSVSGRMQSNKSPEGQTYWSIGNANFMMLGGKTQGGSIDFPLDEDELPPF